MRRVLPGETGPSGGPAMTDLLGVCTSWGDGRLRDRARGRASRSRSGSPTSSPGSRSRPGRPSGTGCHRSRAQLHGLALFPDLVTEPLGDWLLRSSPTATARRANSVLAFVPAGVEDAYERVVAHYDRPVAAVLPESAEYELFRSHGWVPESHDADTLFQIAGVARVRRALRGRRTGAIAPELQSRPTTSVELRRERHRTVVEARIGDVASGVAAYADDWVGFRSIEVAPEHRRRGLGLAVMAALLEWGAEQGATTAYLQVLGDNAPALALYDGLGFTTHHAYCYLTPPGDPAT